jgi:hypothetical protein
VYPKFVEKQLQILRRCAPQDDSALVVVFFGQILLRGGPVQF